MIEREPTRLSTIVPSEFSFRFLSRLSKKEAVKKLEENVTDRNLLTAQMSDKYFVGTIYHSDFKVREIDVSGTALVPVFYGELTEKPEGLLVRIKASNLPASLLTLFWYGFSVGCLWTAASKILRQNAYLAGLFFLILSCILFGIAYFITRFYKRKIQDGKLWLAELLDDVDLKVSEKQRS